MFNHKRLITLSIAASMVIPTFSTMTVLANESFVEVNDQEEMISLETNNAKNSIELKDADFKASSLKSEIFEMKPVTKEDGTTETGYFLKSGDYVLSEDVTVPFTIYTDSLANITIDLGEHTLTSTAVESFHLVGEAFLTIKGATSEKKGTIQNSKPESNNSDYFKTFVAQSGTLKIDNVNLKKDENSSRYSLTSFYIDPQKDQDTKITVEIENSSIQDSARGVMIASHYAKNPEDATVKLKNTSFNCTDTGINQNYGGDITIEDCSIKGQQCGVHANAGNLNIINSSIVQDVPDENSSRWAGGIQLIPSNYWGTPLKANVKNSFASGNNLGLLLDYNTLSANFPIEFSINVSNSTFASTKNKFGFGYRAAEDKYKENDPIFQKNITSLENVVLPQAIEVDENNSGDYKAIETKIIPYTLVGSSTPSKDVKVDISGSLDTVPGTKDILTDTGQKSAEAQLNNSLEEKNTATTKSIYSIKENEIKTLDSKSLSYIEYVVKLTSPQFSKDENKDTYTFQAIITAKLQPKSLICLLIPLTQTKTEAAQVTKNLESENVITTFPLYVELSEVLNNPNNLSSGLSSKKIQNIFDKIKETPDLVLIGEDNLTNYTNYTLDRAELNTFEKIDLTQAFEMKDIGEVIEIKGTEAQKVDQPLTVNTGSSKPKPKPEAPAEEQPTSPVTGTPTSMYRLYNRLTGEHLYTTNKAERDELLTSDTWKDEGQGWTAPSVSEFPVYRLLNPNTGDHHYTTDKNEFDTLPSFGWVAEGIAFFSADKDQEENVILHRIYNPNAQGAGSHHYTTDKNERDSLIAQGWIDEGTAWAGLPTE